MELTGLDTDYISYSCLLTFKRKLFPDLKKKTEGDFLFAPNWLKNSK